MSLHDWTTRHTASWTDEDYLTAHVNAKEAAALLQVSASRWRQVTGSRTTPDPIIGPGYTEPGRRGARWPLRRVLQYAMTTQRDLPTPLPPLLPHPDGDPRYSPSSSRTVRTSQPASTATPTTSAWIDLHQPRSRALCGHAEAPVMVLTPTWPTTTWPMISQMQPLVGAALQSHTWELELNELERLVIVIAPISEGGFTRHVSPDLRVYDVDAGWLEKARSMHAEALSSQAILISARRVEVPAGDIAAAIGQPLPWWPAGTATSSTCPRWAPGHPVTVTVPADDAGRLEAAQWLRQPTILDRERATQRPTDLIGASLEQQARRLASMVLPTNQGHLKPPMETSELPEGLEVAAHIAWPEPIDPPASVDPWPLLDTLLDEESAPAHVVDELFGYFGDPRYAPVARIEFASIPDLWADLFRDQAKRCHVQPLRTPRWRTLQAASPEGTPATFGPLDAPAIVDSHGITWLPPTGHQTTGHDAPHEALPHLSDGPHEVLLVREANNDRVRGWVRTLNGYLSPLPAKSQFDMGNHGDTVILVSALRADDPAALYDQESVVMLATLDASRNGLPDQELPDPIKGSPILRLIRSVTDQPLTLTWTELHALAQQQPSATGKD